MHFEVVEYVEDRINLTMREQHYLDTLKPYFNILKNAKTMLGLKHTEEAKAKNRAAHLGKSPANKGKPMSEKQKQYYRDLYTGRPHGHKTNNGRPSPNRGKHPSDETRDKIREANIRRNAILNLQNLTPEQKAQRDKKSRETKRNMTPERKAEISSKSNETKRNMTPERKAEIKAKRNATMAANRLTQPSKWSLKYNACIVCGTIAKRHVAHGMCTTCFTRKRRA